MEATPPIPLSLEERLKLGTELRIPVSWEEFLEVLPQCEYQVEYYGGEIVSIMGQASDNHEKLALKIGALLLSILGEEDYEFFGSNLPIQATGTNKNYFNADCTVVKGQSEKVQVLPGVSATTNPALLVEVLSPSTQQEDLSTKLHHYRSMPSVQQLLFIDSSEMKVISYTRAPEQGGWLLRDYTESEDRCEVLGEEGFLLEDLYRKVRF
jgi:Uma2 family endonuclease